MTDADVLPRRAFIASGGALLIAGMGRRGAAAQAAFTAADRRAIGQALGLGMDVYALDDAKLTAQVLDFARTETGLRVSPSRLDSNWALDPPVRDLAAELVAARASGRLASWLAALSPTASGYRRLVEARVAYAMMAAAGGWPSLPDGSTLRVGDSGAAVATLRGRLAAEGFSAPTDAIDGFDFGLVEVVQRFQKLHALEPDGYVGAATREALNVSANERLGQIDANLERWRWTSAAPPDRVVVNSGAQQALLFRGGVPVLRMRAIVGTPQHPTPMFRSAVTAVVFNPPWNVPDSIARNELLPAAAKRPGLLEAMGIRWVDGRLQQRPGPNNSLGLVKFDVESPFGVYLHDTPGKGLFAQPVRAFSHGCMRLEKPRELAAALLAWSSDAVDAAIAGGTTRRLALRRPVPLFVVHHTVWVQADGRVAFRPDIYGWDRKLSAALPTPDIAHRPDSSGPKREA